MAIKSSDIDLLRKITGKSMLDCLSALKDGDFMCALERLGGDIKNASASSFSTSQVYKDGSNKCSACKNPLTNSTTHCEWCDAPLASAKNMENHDEVFIELVRSGRKLEAVKYYKDKYHVGLKEAKEKVDLFAKK